MATVPRSETAFFSVSAPPRRVKHPDLFPSPWSMALVAIFLFSLYAPALFAAPAKVPIISWQTAGKHTEQRVIVQGVVSKGYDLNGICYLRFDEDPHSLVILIERHASGREDVPPPLYSAFLDQNIQVNGVIHLNKEKGRLELAVHSLSQFIQGSITPAPAAKKAQQAKLTPVSLKNAPITASSTQQQWEGEGPPSSMLDGDMTTRWSSQYQDGQQIVLDLGKTIPVAGIDIYWEVASAKSYTIAVSQDQHDWQVVSEQVQGTKGPRNDELRFAPHAARYIRLDLLKRATEYGFSIYEIKIFKGKD